MEATFQIPNPKINWRLYANEIAARNARILILHFDEHVTMQIIGERFGISRQRVHQIVKKHAPAPAQEKEKP